ncbi:hypothetical protein ACJX0J_030928 [Zea mays]
MWKMDGEETFHLKFSFPKFSISVAKNGNTNQKRVFLHCAFIPLNAFKPDLKRMIFVDAAAVTWSLWLPVVAVLNFSTMFPEYVSSSNMWIHIFSTQHRFKIYGTLVKTFQEEKELSEKQIYCPLSCFQLGLMKDTIHFLKGIEGIGGVKILLLFNFE